MSLSNASVLKGYDMFLCLSQNELNSQFQRLYKNGIIHHLLVANGLSKSRSKLRVTSLIRGSIKAPTIQLHNEDLKTDIDQIKFKFKTEFQKVLITPSSITESIRKELKLSNPNISDAELSQINITLDDMEDAILGDGKNALLVVNEPIYYRDEQGVLQNLGSKEVYYWLQVVQSGMDSVFYLLPSLYFKDDDEYILIDLSSLGFELLVDMAKMPKTIGEVQQLVEDGLASPAMLYKINERGFNSAAFELEQLFLNFNTTDFSEISIIRENSVDKNISILEIIDEAISQVPATDIFDNNNDFSLAFGRAIRYAFGFQDKNVYGRTPYVFGISVSRKKVNEGDLVPTLQPTYISMSNTPNKSEPGLSAVNFEMLGGPDSINRIPKMDDEIIHINQQFISDNNFSGKIILSNQAFVEGFIIPKIMDAFGTKASSWVFSNNRWTYTFSEIDVEDKKLLDSMGGLRRFSHDLSKKYEIILNKNKGIKITGEVNKTIYGVLSMFTADQANAVFKFASHRDGKYTFSMDLSVLITSGNLVSLDVSAPVTTENLSDIIHDNATTGIMEAMAEMVRKLLNDESLTTLEKSLSDFSNDIVSDLQNNIEEASNKLKENFQLPFVPPTGDVFLFKNPKFNDNFDLKIDLTYNV